MHALSILLTACLALASAWPASAQITISIADGDDDGFGGTQGTDSDPGDAFTPFATPTVAPGTHGVSGNFTDRTTVAPWTPYSFQFHFGHPAFDPQTILSATIGIQMGGVARRGDNTGFGYATVTLTDLATNDTLVLGDLLEIDTGAPDSTAENQVRMPSWDITSFIHSRPFTDTLYQLEIDGSALSNPGDQFALDFAIIVEELDDGVTTTTTSTTEPPPTTTAEPSTTTTVQETTTTTTMPAPEPLCGAAPRTGCKQAGKSSLLLSAPGDSTKRKLKWKWKGGDAVSPADFGDPVTGETTQYVLCIYDSSAAAQPLVEATIPTGPCGGETCWKTAGAGAKYKSKSGSPDGITSVLLKPGAAGKAQVKVGGKGNALPLPGLGLTTPVTVQLVADTPAGVACWQSSFTQAATNDSDTFKAKAP